MLSPAVMTSWSDMASPISRFVGVEVIERRFAAARHRSMVTVLRVIAIINVTVKTTSAMEPRTRTYENPARKPVWSIVPIWSTTVRRVIKVPVRTNGRSSDADRNLGRCC
jgi:hypothetical protein